MTEKTPGRQPRSRPFIDILRAERDLISRLASMSHLDDVAVFGSVARREDDESSDVDLLVTPRPEATMFSLAQLEIDLERLLHRRVTVVSTGALDPALDEQIIREAVHL